MECLNNLFFLQIYQVSKEGGANPILSYHSQCFSHNIFSLKNVQWCSEQTGHLLFFIQNAHSCEGRKLPKRYVKFTNFSSIACINVESFSISFGSKISIGSGYTYSSCQSFDFPFSLPKLTFFTFLNF